MLGNDERNENGCARRFKALGAAWHRIPLLGFVGALLIGVRLEPAVRVTWMASVARADDGAAENRDSSARARAKELLVEGVDLLKHAQYESALERFDAAYALVPSPNIHYDRALACVGLQRSAAALEEFETFLDEATHPPSGTREEAQRHVTDLRARVAWLDPNMVPSGAEIIVDGNRRGTTPLARWIYLDPGRHEISIRVSGVAAVIREPVNARAGEAVEVTMDLDPSAPTIAAETRAAAMSPAVRLNFAGETPPPAASKPWLSSTGARNGAILAMAGGVVLLGAGLTFGLLAQRAGDSLTNASRSATPTKPAVLDPQTQNSGKADQRLETILVGAGAVALTGGILLYALNRHRAAGSSASVKSIPARAGYALIGAPLFGSGLAGARLRMQF